MTIDEGVIKFKYQKYSDQKREDFKNLHKFKSLHCRLHELGMLGFDNEHQVSYGNLSHKDQKTGNIFVSSTDTGKLKKLENENICQIITVDVEKNLVSYLGDFPPSSESMTHYFCYQAHAFFSWVVHIHHENIWNLYLENRLTFIPKEIPYGTPEMAREIQLKISEKIKEKSDLSSISLAMAGHDKGVIYCAKKADVCLDLILSDLKNSQK